MSVLVDLVKEDFGISGRGRWFRSDIHSSLVIDSDNDKFFFNSRNISGDALDYLMKVRGLSRKSAEDLLKSRSSIGINESKRYSLQSRYSALVDLFYSSGKSNRSYWYEKGLKDNTIDRFKLGFFDDWFLIPIYDKNLFVNFQCRKSHPEKRIKFWYSDPDFKPVLFNCDITKFVDTIYITEGMVDCLLLNQEGLPSVCSTNGANHWNPTWIKYFSKIKNIFFILDNDNAGINAGRKVSSMLGDSRVRLFRFKDEEKGFGALDFINKGNTGNDLKTLLMEKSVYGFQKDSI